MAGGRGSLVHGAGEGGPLFIFGGMAKRAPARENTAEGGYSPVSPLLKPIFLKRSQGADIVGLDLNR